MYHKIKLKYLFLLFLVFVMLLIGSCLDLTISNICYISQLGSKNLFGIIFSYIGVIPAFVGWSFLGTIIFILSKNESNKKKKIVLRILAVLLVLFTLFFLSNSIMLTNQNTFNVHWFIAYGITIISILFSIFGGYKFVQRGNCANDDKLLNEVVLIAVISILTIILTMLVKEIMARPRYIFVLDVNDDSYFINWWQNGHSILKMVKETKVKDAFSSFPSGHSSYSMLSIFIIPLLFRNNKKIKKLEILLFSFATMWWGLTAYSRITVGAHYLTDVCFGGMITLISYYIVILINNCIIKKNSIKCDNNEIIYLVTTSVQEDISKSVGISWHCKKSKSFLVYKKEDNNEEIKVLPLEEIWSIEESYMDDEYNKNRYVCNVILDNLDANTKYIYRIICGDVISREFRFKTSDSSSRNYSFLSFADFQYSCNKSTKNIVKTFINNNPDSTLIMCSGDIADEAYKEESHRYLFDSDVFSNSILSFAVGDHEYWGTIKSPIKMLNRPYSYNKLFNNPKNGCLGYLNTSYYFKYNSTLFIFLDCGDSNVGSSNEMFNLQAKWLDDVLSIKKDYEFIIVCMHKSLYGDINQDSTVRNFANIFTKVFDKYLIDLVISGHDHEYSRTKPLVNNEIKEDGTIYLDLGSSGDKNRYTGDEIKLSNLYDKYIDIKEKKFALGMVGSVSDGVLNIKVFNQNYNLVDEVKIYKKIR